MGRRAADAERQPARADLLAERAGGGVRACAARAAATCRARRGDRYVEHRGRRPSLAAKENAMRFQDKVVIVTGAGSGIGLATALRFGAEGARVVVAEFDDAKGKAAEAQLRGA